MLHNNFFETEMLVGTKVGSIVYKLRNIYKITSLSLKSKIVYNIILIVYILDGPDIHSSATNIRCVVNKFCIKQTFFCESICIRKYDNHVLKS